jgi:LPS-assembly lipoprotein
VPGARDQEPESKSRRRRWFAPRLLIPGAWLLLSLAGCGFHPLYTEREQAAAETPELAAIRVLPIKDRIGQQLELALREALNPHGAVIDTRYQLSVALTVARYDLGILRDASSTRGRVDVVAVFQLLDAKSNKVVYSTRTQSTSSFNILNDAYSAEVAEEDARTRTVRDLTDDIVARLAIFLHRERA